MKKKNEKGFTLIELLVVIAIIGILAAIAVPQFAQYRALSYCSRVESDAANALVSVEGYFAEDPDRGYPADIATTGFIGTPNVTLALTSGPPIGVTGSDATGNCPKGTFQLTQGGDAGDGWTAAP